MKKILIRVESYKKSWLWWMETRIKDFLSKSYNNKSNFTILSNRKLDNFFEKEIIFENYNNIKWIINDILKFRNYDIIESNWHRDNLISILNYLIFFPLYKIKDIKLFIVIHWIVWLKLNKWLQKIIYNIILYIWIILSNKIIVVSDETKNYIKKEYRKLGYLLNKKIIIIPNYVDFNKNSYKNEILKLSKWLIVSRIEKNKIKWVIATINFCNRYNIKLDIYWWWEEIKNLKKIYKNINFLWEVYNKNIKYNEYDIIFWMWRSLLEWLSKNLIWVLIWYDKLICNLELENLKNIESSNFSWRNIIKIDDKKIYKNLNKNIKNKEYIKISRYIKNKYWLENFKYYWI